MELNGKEGKEEACSRTETSPGDRDHRIDIPGSRDATTIDGIAAELRSLKAQVEEERALVRQMIHDNRRSEKEFTIQGKSLERLKEEHQTDVVRLENITAFERVKNRLWIKQNTVFNEVLEDGERSLKLITQRVDRREKRVEDLTNQVFNLVGFFSVFQGVILTAVTQLSTSVTSQLGAPQVQARPLCGKVWVPVILSALAAVVSVVAVFLKFQHLSTLDKSITDEKHDQSAAAKKVETLRSRGENFKFSSVRDKKKKPTTRYWLFKCFAVIGALIVFTVLLCLSYFVILCDKWVLPGWN